MIKLNNKEVVFKHFPNGEVYFEEKELVTNPKESYHLIDFKYENNAELIHLMFLKNLLSEITPKAKVDLVMPFVPYSRMDRKIENYPFTLKYFADFINSLNFTNVFVVDIHSQKTEDLINNTTHRSFLFTLLERANFSNKNAYMFFPDKGALKRFNFLTRDFKLSKEQVLTAEKKRDLQTGKIISYDLVGSLNNLDTSKTVYIVDDLCSAGGTFEYASRLLAEHGFSKIILVVSHMENTMFENGQLLRNDLIKAIYTSDSLFDSNKYSHPKVNVLEIFTK